MKLEKPKCSKALKIVSGPGTTPLPKAILATMVVECFTVFSSTINFCDASNCGKVRVLGLKTSNTKLFGAK